ncbi:MAG TPA: hypothetical protein PKJ97_00435 [Candidatus Bilamarchaeaceae archaeon]|nr:hypothetical protein [Candidatus Bilamarchaeaceae archaeon]
MFDILEKLKAAGIMASVIRKDGSVQGSNFNIPDGVDSMASASFNIGDALMKEVKDEATELIITAGPKHIIMRAMDQENILFCIIASKEQYDAYRSVLGPKE